MTDLGMMTGKAALRLAKEESGLTRDEIAGAPWRVTFSHQALLQYKRYVYAELGNDSSIVLGFG